MRPIGCWRSEKGFEAMAMDDIATMVGVAKGSLYKHFESKEVLAAAVMTRLLKQTSDALSALGPSMSAFDKRCALLRWTLMQRLARRCSRICPRPAGPCRRACWATAAT